MSDYIDGLYDAALNCEIMPEEFWNLSILEACDRIDSFRRREEQRQKQTLVGLHFLAKDISQYVGCILGGREDVKPLELWDFFPELFQSEKVAAEEQRKTRELAEYKARMTDFAHHHNYAWEKKGGGVGNGRHDTGKASGDY